MKAPAPETLVDIRDVVKTYRRGRDRDPITAVDGVSLEVARGETLGIVGESGSGKSTVAKLVMGLERPDSGTVVIDGVDVRTARGSELRALQRRRQLVFQDPRSSLNRRRTVRQCIEAPLIVHGVAAGERKARVTELLELVGLNRAHESAYPTQLSGGQAQRVAIARALALNPDLIVLDEAVSSLDVSVQAQVLNLLRSLQAQFGLTYLFIAHDLAVVRFMATRIAVMKTGRVVELADRETLFAAPAHEYTRSLLDAVPEPPAPGEG